MPTDAVRIVQILTKGSTALLRLGEDQKELTIPAELVAQHRLIEGIMITSAQVRQLSDEAVLISARRTARGLLAFRAHSVGELDEKLRRRQIDETIRRQVIRELKTERLLDDSAFAFELVSRALAVRPAGRSVLIALLRRKRIERSLAEEVVDHALGGVDETALAVAALARRWEQLRQFDLETSRSKAYTFLARRGIRYQAAKAAVEQLLKKDEPR